MAKKNFKKEAQKKFGFTCDYCGSWVSKGQFIGTRFRNHCPFCLWSKHVDKNKSGDRYSFCRGLMKPIGLTFKKEGFDKYGKERQGELMLIHHCQKCGEISINRLAADDDAQMVLKVFKDSQKLEKEILEKIKSENIKLLNKENEKEVRIQLFGKNI
jgi:hypothetical protein